VRIESPFSVAQILDVNLIAKANEHATLKLVALLHDDDSTQGLKKDLSGQGITLRDSDGNVLFSGPIQTANIDVTNELYKLYVTCRSYSFLLDIKENYRSFQALSDTYQSVLEFVHEQSVIVVNKRHYIAAPEFQYQETDWKFTLRLASHFCTVVIPGHIQNEPYVCFGVPTGKTYTISEDAYEVGFDDYGYQYRKSEHPEIASVDFMYRKVRSMYNYQLGDKIENGGATFTIFEKYMTVVDGYLDCRYTIGSEHGFGIRNYDNVAINGAILFGTVLEREYDKVKVHFDFDPHQDKETAFWFPYLPDTANTFYSTPIVGTRVGVKVQTGTPVAIHCERTNGQQHALLSDYNQRYFTTEFSKRLAMETDTMFFTGGSNRLEANDGQGIKGITQKSVVVSASGDISINGNSVNIITPEMIKASKMHTETNITMAGNEINIYSIDTQIHSDGTDEMPYPTRDIVPAMTMSSDIAVTALGAQAAVSKVS